MKKILFRILLLLPLFGLAVLWGRRRGRQVVDARQPVQLVLGDLQLTILRRAYPEAADVWNRNWLTAEAICTSEPSPRRRSGEIISSTHLSNWQLGLRQLLAGMRRDLVIHGDLPQLCLHLTGPNADGNFAVLLQLVDAAIGDEHFTLAGELAADKVAESSHHYRVTRTQLERFSAEVRQALLAFPEMKIGDW
jgi:hypothetical protein